jgi:hypothetical protein
MLIAPTEPLPFIKNYIEALDKGLKKHTGKGLSLGQAVWLGFCLMGILVTNSVCWARFERASFGLYRFSALSWMFRHTRLSWAKLLPVSVELILAAHGLTEGILVGDDSDRARTKGVKRIHKAHKLKDKPTGGYRMGQSLVMLLLVTPVLTIPVGFAFYHPDPRLKAWEKEEQRLKKQGVPKKDRPAKPERNPCYPTKADLLLELLAKFKAHFPNFRVKAILADALYGQKTFMNAASRLFNGVQVISQVRGNQLIRSRGKWISLDTYFTRNGGVTQKLRIRGEEHDTLVTVSAARLVLKAHSGKRFIIALKYEGETEYRYLVATDLSWRYLDIVQVYTLRWLIEVFFEDWKLYEGWGQLAKQTGEEGSSRGLILSLLLDHCLLLHPEQTVRLESKQPACTVGSLCEKSRVQALRAFIRRVLDEDNPQDKLRQLADQLEDLFPLRDSTKHMNGRDLGRIGPTPSLKYQAVAA